MDVWELGSYPWELTILRVVDALQRTKVMVTTTDIYEALEQGMFKELTEQDLRKPPEWGGQPAYRYMVLTYLSRLTRAKKPDLDRVSRGVYRITEKGKGRIKHGCS